MGNARKIDRLQAYVMKEDVLKHQETMCLSLEPGKRKIKPKEIKIRPRVWFSEIGNQNETEKIHKTEELTSCLDCDGDSIGVYICQAQQTAHFNGVLFLGYKSL